MAKSNGSLYQRIRYIKSSLDNAEQSFLDNKEMRGELDLMLAEAEFKNLRRKKDVPWNWNRQLLACCAALMLALAGLGGWFYARDGYVSAPATASPVIKEQAPVIVENTVVEKQVEVPADVHNEAVSSPSQEVHISKASMRKLVQSARVELSSSK